MLQIGRSTSSRECDGNNCVHALVCAYLDRIYVLLYVSESKFHCLSAFIHVSLRVCWFVDFNEEFIAFVSHQASIVWFDGIGSVKHIFRLCEKKVS